MWLHDSKFSGHILKQLPLINFNYHQRSFVGLWIFSFQIPQAYLTADAQVLPWIHSSVSVAARVRVSVPSQDVNRIPYALWDAGQRLWSHCLENTAYWPGPFCHTCIFE